MRCWGQEDKYTVHIRKLCLLKSLWVIEAKNLSSEWISRRRDKRGVPAKSGWCSELVTSLVVYRPMHAERAEIYQLLHWL